MAGVIGNTISGAGEGFNKATEGIPWWAKVALIGGVIGVGGYLAYEALSDLTGGTPPGGSCTQPGSPCYSALQPYINSYNICAQQYATYLNQYLKEDSANGTGLTQAQSQNLAYLTNCMNNNASQIAKTAKQYEPQNALDILVTFVGEGLFAALALYGAAKFLAVLKNNKPITGSGAANAIKNALIRKNIDDGTISPDEAAGLSDQLGNETQGDIAENNDVINTYAEDEIITTDEAQQVETEDADNMEADTTDTLDELDGLE